MKVNKFDVDCDLEISADGWQLTGWFETPALPNVRYTIEIDLNELFQIAEDNRLDAELEAEAEIVAKLPDDPASGEQVQLPDGEVTDVTPTLDPPAPDTPTVAEGANRDSAPDAKPTD